MNRASGSNKFVNSSSSSQQPGLPRYRSDSPTGTGPILPVPVGPVPVDEFSELDNTIIDLLTEGPQGLSKEKDALQRQVEDLQRQVKDLQRQVEDLQRLRDLQRQVKVLPRIEPTNMEQIKFNMKQLRLIFKLVEFEVVLNTLNAPLVQEAQIQIDLLHRLLTQSLSSHSPSPPPGIEKIEVLKFKLGEIIKDFNSLNDPQMVQEAQILYHLNRLLTQFRSKHPPR